MLRAKPSPAGRAPSPSAGPNHSPLMWRERLKLWVRLHFPFWPRPVIIYNSRLPKITSAALNASHFYFIPRTNPFLETFLRDKRTKQQKALDNFSCGEEPGGKHDVEGFFVCQCFFLMSHGYHLYYNFRKSKINLMSLRWWSLRILGTYLIHCINHLWPWYILRRMWGWLWALSVVVKVSNLTQVRDMMWQVSGHGGSGTTALVSVFQIAGSLAHGSRELFAKTLEKVSSWFECNQRGSQKHPSQLCSSNNFKCN